MNVHIGRVLNDQNSCRYAIKLTKDIVLSHRRLVKNDCHVGGVADIFA